MKNQTVKELMFILVACAFLGLPVAANADSVVTYTAPTTAGNGNGTVVPRSSNDPTNANYQGGNQQFDLDHHDAYTWQIGTGNTFVGQRITGATLTFRAISNWETSNNILFVHLLDTSVRSGVASFIDDSSSVPSRLSDAFGADLATNPLVAAGTGNTLLFQQGFLKVGQTASGATPWANPFFSSGVYTARDYVYNFSAAQLATLSAYILGGTTPNLFALGFDPDCHFWNNGVTLTISYAPRAVPEPASMILLGSGLSGLGYFLRRRRQQA